MMEDKIKLNKKTEAALQKVGEKVKAIQDYIDIYGVPEPWNSYAIKRKMLSEYIQRYRGYIEKETGIFISEKPFMFEHFLKKYKSFDFEDFAKIDPEIFLKELKEYAKNNKKKIEDILNSPDNHDLPHISDNKLKEIFNASKFGDFPKIEEVLFNRNYIDENRKWKEKAPGLVALILVLKNNRYFKNAAGDIKIRNFFQELYDIDISQQFKPSNQHKAERYKQEFISIISAL